MATRTLTAVTTAGWSYVINENGKAVRLMLHGYGPCTPSDVLQKYTDELPSEKFDELWLECEQKKDVVD